MSCALSPTSLPHLAAACPELESLEWRAADLSTAPNSQLAALTALTGLRQVSLTVYPIVCARSRQIPGSIRHLS